MFNGIIFDTGKIKSIKKKKNSIYVGIQTKLNFSKKDLGSSVSDFHWKSKSESLLADFLSSSTILQKCEVS